jgi:UDP:flavonoid glycosyltransferase YjiC (YdhE family)
MGAARASSLRVLFVGEGVTLSHVVRPLVLARATSVAGHHVHFACGGEYRRFVEDARVEVEPLPTMSPREFTARIAVGKPLYTYSRLEEYVTAERDLLSRLSPDVVVGDFRVSLAISAEAQGILYVALSNAHWSPFSTLEFPVAEHPLVRILGPRLARPVIRRLLPLISRLHIAAFNRLRQEHGLSRVTNLQEMYTRGSWTLYLDLPRLSPTRDLPATHRYIGPVLWEPDLPLPEWWDRVDPEVPIVYVTLGSSGHPGLLPRVLQAFENLPVVAAVATAGQPVDRVPDNVRVADYLPAMKIMERARVVVSNGGSGTTYQAMAAGVPILGLPFNSDQYFAMEGVVREGAGILVRSGLASVDGVRAALHALLEDPRFVEAARRVQADMGRYRVEPAFVTFIETAIVPWLASPEAQP